MQVKMHTSRYMVQQHMKATQQHYYRIRRFKALRRFVVVVVLFIILVSLNYL